MSATSKRVYAPKAPKLDPVPEPEDSPEKLELDPLCPWAQLLADLDILEGKPWTQKKIGLMSRLAHKDTLAPLSALTPPLEVKFDMCLDGLNKSSARVCILIPEDDFAEAVQAFEEHVMTTFKNIAIERAIPKAKSAEPLSSLVLSTAGDGYLMNITVDIDDDEEPLLKIFDKEGNLEDGEIGKHCLKGHLMRFELKPLMVYLYNGETYRIKWKMDKALFLEERNSTKRERFEAACETGAKKRKLNPFV